ncbi:hypothetical protein HU200_010576 [Digitaria exilis]|uniref:Uncharacterized protein n=1 Tax=Digitaria exilis TaxID=1010633 RepID=A0A835FI18_9POAL|nr:hypothetical protein HU200_010576 [Digitaria exilis]
MYQRCNVAMDAKNVSLSQVYQMLIENEEGTLQVDSAQMEHIFSTLVDHLQIQEGYNIFILNPKPFSKGVNYGYRKGFSESEINLLRENKTLQARILQSKSDNKLFLADIEKGVNRKPLYENHPLSSFSWASTDSMDMGDWSKKCKEALSKFEMLKEGKSKDDIVYDKAVQVATYILLEWAVVLIRALFSEVTEEEAEEKLQDTIRERFSFGEDYHAVDILLAEIDVYELFAFKHCVGRRVQLALCKELDERMHDLKNELEGYNIGDSDEINKQKAIHALKRMEIWNLFRDTKEEHHRLSLSEEPAFMMAFSMARRAAAVPLLLVNGTYKSTVNTYLDSAILQHQLQKLSEHNSLRGILYILLCAFKFYRVEDNWL